MHERECEERHATGEDVECEHHHEEREEERSREEVECEHHREELEEERHRHHRRHHHHWHHHHHHHHKHHHHVFDHVPFRGLLHLLILKLLEEKPLRGSEVRESLRSRLELDIPSSTVYAVLGILEEKGLVTSSWETDEKGAARKVYRITEEGLDYLKERIDEIKRTKKILDYLTS